MTTSLYLLSTAVMGAFVLGVAYVVARGREWRRYVARFDPRAERDRSATPLSWTVGFVLALVGLGGFMFLSLTSGSAVPFLLAIGVLVVAFLAAGVYLTGKSNGHPHSHAVGEAIITVGAVVLVGVVGWLLLTAGA